MSGNNNDNPNYGAGGADEADSSGAGSASRLDQGSAGRAASGHASYPAGGFGQGFAVARNVDDNDSDDSDSVEPMRPWAADAEFKAMRMPEAVQPLRSNVGALQSKSQFMPGGFQKQQQQQQSRLRDDFYPHPVIKRNTWANPVLVKVPMYHKVDPFHLTLPCASESDLNKVLGSLSDIFRRESVQANCFPSPIKAALLTMDNNELQLNVWESPKEEGKIIVEIQRCRGDLMHCIRKAESVLDALKQDLTSGRPAPSSQPGVPLELHPEGLQKIEELLQKANAGTPAPVKPQQDSPSGSPRSSQDEISVAPLEMIQTLFRSDRWDSRRLGLESLLIMSDPRRSDLSTVIETGYAVLLGNMGASGSSNAELIHDVIFRIVLQRQFKTDDPRAPTSVDLDSMEVDTEDRVNFLSDDEDDASMTDAVDSDWIEDAGKTWPRRSDYDEYMSGLFHIALATLTNSISVVLSFCGYSGGGQDLLKFETAERIADLLVYRADQMMAQSDIQQEPDSLIGVLLRCIRRAHNKYPNAALACMSLRYLCRGSATICERVRLDEKAKEYVKKAIKVGKECHQQLDLESSELFRTLSEQSHV